MSTTETFELSPNPPRPRRLSVAGLARSGVIAGIIKLASAGLSFLMFVAVAKVTDERQFGLYSAAYAGASLVSFFAGIGQPAAVLRFWPQHADGGHVGTANAMMWRSTLVALGGLVVSTAASLEDDDRGPAHGVDRPAVVSVR